MASMPFSLTMINNSHASYDESEKSNENDSNFQTAHLENPETLVSLTAQKRFRQTFCKTTIRLTYSWHLKVKAQRKIVEIFGPASSISKELIHVMNENETTVPKQSPAVSETNLNPSKNYILGTNFGI